MEKLRACARRVGSEERAGIGSARACKAVWAGPLLTGGGALAFPGNVNTPTPPEKFKASNLTVPETRSISV